MVTRVEWLQLQLRYGRRPARLPFALFILLTFEAYYQLCALRGYRPRHALLEPLPESLRAVRPGERVLVVWPRLPLSIRVLERVCPYASGTQAGWAPYTPEAEAAARAAGRRTEVVEVVPGELHYGGSFT
jgi:hypothetical protein